MKILTFSCYYTPEIAASMYLTEDLLEGMAKAGHYIEMYVPMPCRGIDDEMRKKYKRKKKEVLYDGHLIIHRFSLYKEGKGVLSRAFRYALLNIIFICKGLSTKSDVIFAQSTPPTQGMMAGIIKKIKKIPLVYNLQDVFPDSLVNTGITSKGSVMWKIGRKIEDFTYKNASRIIVISEDFKKNIMEKGVPERKIVVVPNWADVKGVFPVDRNNNKLIKKYGLDPDKFYITYSGNIGYTQNMDMLLDSAKEVKDDLKDLRFVLIGDGAAKESVAKRIKEEKIDNVILLPFQKYEDIAHVFSLGDAGLIISKPGVGNNSVPSKTWSIMAAQRPILASFDKNSELCSMIDSVGCGICVEAGDRKEFIGGIKRLVQNYDFNMGKLGYKYITQKLDRTKCVNKYVKVITGGKKKIESDDCC